MTSNLPGKLNFAIQTPRGPVYRRFGQTTQVEDSVANVEEPVGDGLPLTGGTITGNLVVSGIAIGKASVEPGYVLDIDGDIRVSGGDFSVSANLDVASLGVGSVGIGKPGAEFPYALDVVGAIRTTDDIYLNTTTPVSVTLNNLQALITTALTNITTLQGKVAVLEGIHSAAGAYPV